MFRSKRVLCGAAALLVPVLLALPLSVAALEDTEPAAEESLCLQEAPAFGEELVAPEELVVQTPPRAFSDIETEILPIEEEDPVWTRYEENDALLYFRNGWNRIRYSTPTAAFSGGYASRAFSSQASLDFTFTGSAVQIGTYCNVTQGSLLISVDGEEAEELDLNATVPACAGMFVQCEQGRHSVRITANGKGGVWLDYIDIADGSLLETSVDVDRRTLDCVTVEEDEFSLTGTWLPLSYSALTKSRALRTKDSDATASYTFRGYNALDLISYRSPNYGSCKVTLTRMSDGVTVNSQVTDLSTVALADAEYQYYLYSFDGLNPAERYTITLSVTTPGRVWNALVDALKLYREKDLEMSALLPFTERPIYKTLDDPHKAAYRAIFDAAVTLDRGYIDLGETEKMPAGNVAMIYRALRDDFPEIFWLPQSYASGTYSPDNTDDTKTVLAFCYPNEEDPGQSIDYPIADAAALKEAYLAVMRRVDEAENRQLNTGMDKYQISVALHDWICASGEYDYTGSAEEFSWDIYGILVNGSGVCESYARSYQLLLREAGMDCRMVYGTDVSDEPGNHAWNALEIDGSWYYSDLTWDDTAAGSLPFTHIYCNTNATWLLRDHALAADGLADPGLAQSDVVNFFLPECTATDANYYVQTGTMISSESAFVSTFVNAFAPYPDGGTIEFFLSFKPDLTAGEFLDLMNDRHIISEILAVLDKKTASYSYQRVSFDQPVVILTVR